MNNPEIKQKRLPYPSLEVIKKCVRGTLKNKQMKKRIKTLIEQDEAFSKHYFNMWERYILSDEFLSLPDFLEQGVEV